MTSIYHYLNVHAVRKYRSRINYIFLQYTYVRKYIQIYALFEENKDFLKNKGCVIDNRAGRLARYSAVITEIIDTIN